LEILDVRPLSPALYPKGKGGDTIPFSSDAQAFCRDAQAFCSDAQAFCRDEISLRKGICRIIDAKYRPDGGDYSDKKLMMMWEGGFGRGKD
jgi:hypothetical protein